jgi:hypothetical protein
MKRFSLTVALLFVCSITMASAAETAPINKPQVLTWTRPAAYTDGAAVASTAVVLYDVYLSQTGKPPFAKIASAITATTYTAQAPIDTPCYYVTATIAGAVSAHSEMVCKSTVPVPKAPTLTVTTG